MRRSNCGALTGRCVCSNQRHVGCLSSGETSEPTVFIDCDTSITPVVQYLAHHHWSRDIFWKTRPLHIDMEVYDRTPPLIVSTIAIVGIIWVVMVLGIRLYLRYKLNGPIGNDDYAAILATTLGIAQSAVVLAGVHSGLGHRSTIDDESHDQTTIKVIKFFSCLKKRPLTILTITAEQIGYAATLLYLSATYVSRASSCLLYIRLTSTRSHLVAAFAGLGMSAVGGLICLMAIAFQCRLPAPWRVPDGRSCIDMASRPIVPSMLRWLTRHSGVCGKASSSQLSHSRYSSSASRSC